MTADPALPDSYVELVDLLGADLADLVVARLGGARLYIPRTVGAEHPLARAVGLDNAVRVCSVFQGGYLDVPNLRVATADRTRRIVWRMKAAGKTVNEIALAAGVTWVRVYQILRETKPGPQAAPERQPRLL